MKQLTWLRIIHSGEWCLRTHSGDWQKLMSERVDDVPMRCFAEFSFGSCPPLRSSCILCYLAYWWAFFKSLLECLHWQKPVVLPTNSEHSEELERLKRQYVSSKLSYLVFYLRHLLTDTPDCTVIVFSQVRYLLIVTIFIIIKLIIGSDQRSETKKEKIVRFRSCLRHFRFIISCRRHFVRFILNFIHFIPKKGVISRL